MLDDYDLDAMRRDGLDPCDWLLADGPDDLARFEPYRRSEPAAPGQPTPYTVDPLRASMTPDEWADFCAECAEEDAFERLIAAEQVAVTVDVPWHGAAPYDPSLPF